MGAEWVHDLKVAELKEELKKRGLPVSGKKADLAERLEAYVVENEGGGSAEKREKSTEAADDAAGDDTAEQAEAAAAEAVPAAQEPEAAVEAAPSAAADEGGEGSPAPAAAEEPAAQKSEGQQEKQHEQEQEEEKQQEGEQAAEAMEEEPAAAAPAEEHKDASPVAAAAPEQAPGGEAMEQEQQQEQEQNAKPAAEEAAHEEAAAAAPMEELDYGESDHEEPAVPAAAPASDRKGRGSEGRKRDREVQPSAERPAAAERPAKVVRRDSSRAGGGVPEAGERPNPEDVPAAEEPVTRALRIDNFVRPFTEGQVRALLNEHGFVKAMWMPSIKTHCYAVFENRGQAEAARKATWQLQWPASNPKRLAPRFVPLSEAEAAIGKGSGNPEFKIARTAEDGEEEQQQGGGGGGSEQQGDAAAGKEGDAAVQALDKRLVERRRSREWNRERPSDEEAPARDGSEGPAALGGVRDLREMLSSRRSSGRDAKEGPERGGSRSVLDRLDSRDRREPERRLQPAKEPSPEPERGLSLDELFRKTEAKPAIYWLPLTEEQIAEKKVKAAAAAAAAAAAQQGSAPAANGQAAAAAERAR